MNRSAVEDGNLDLSQPPCIAAAQQMMKIRNVTKLRTGPFTLLGLLLMLLSSMANKLQGQAIVAEGNMTITLYANGQMQMRMARYFTCTLKDCGFEIASFLDDTTNKMTYIYDGDALYKMLQSTPTNKTEFRNAGNHGLVADGVVNVVEGMPVKEDGSYNQIIWLAYASRCYFGSLTNHLAKPLWQLDDPQLETNGYAIPVFYRTNKDSLGLLQNAHFLSDGIYRGYDRKAKRRIQIPYPAPFDQGFTNAEYEALKTTNMLGAIIPTEFGFVRYGSPLNGKLLPRFIVHGNITNLYKSKLEGFAPPKIAGILNVHDYRGHGNMVLSGASNRTHSYVNYFITNGNWPEPKRLKTK